MFKKIKTLILLIVLIPAWAVAQHSITGRISDNNTSENLPNAHITLVSTLKRTVSNIEGKFAMSKISDGKYTIRVSYLGYENYEKEIDLETDIILNIALIPSAVMQDEVIISATRASDRSGTTFQNITKKDIKKADLGKDLPYVMNMTPSVVASSDAGAGVGYTSIRIRGTDISRINVTMNGIPMNDPESQGVWWVNMPDLAGSLNSIQIQRGIGTSSNGAAAFGASINMYTSSYAAKPYAEISTAIGSFNTQKYRVLASTGLINGKWSFDTRLSKIHSDGFVDRAMSDLNSYFVSAAHYGKKSVLRFNLISGKEKTYQSWNGVPKVRLQNDSAGMQRYENHYLYSHKQTQEMLASDSRTYNKYTYDNETDNYQQTHYQLLYSKSLNSNWRVNTALHYTKGAGYYESFKANRKLSKYGLRDFIIGNDTISKTDAIHQKHLDNDFYGTTISLEYNNKKDLVVIIGGAANHYFGHHFGKIVWAKYAKMGKDYEWYRNTGEKNTYNAYAKVNYSISKKFSVYGDLQYRQIDYWMKGLHDDFLDLSSDYHFNFTNPKFGVNYQINDNSEMYLSVAMAQKEPSRNDFRDAERKKLPKAEMLLDYELGYSFNIQKILLRANVYYMDYRNQLIATGKINNVGAAIMTNIDRSYRAGIEFVFGVRLNNWMNWNVNFSFSQNKIFEYTEYVDNWNTGKQDSVFLGTTDIAMSPNMVAANQFQFLPFKHAQILFNTKYVGKRYIDNSANDLNSIAAYTVSDLIFHYELTTKFMRGISLNFSINNIFNAQYETNAWVYSYNVDDTYSGKPAKRYTMDGYFPQAGINFMFGVDLKF